MRTAPGALRAAGSTSPNPSPQGRGVAEAPECARAPLSTCMELLRAAPAHLLEQECKQGGMGFRRAASCGRHNSCPRGPALAIHVPQLSLEPVQCQGRAGDLLGHAWRAAEPCCQPAPVLAAPPHSVICEGQGPRRHSALQLSNHQPGAWRYPSALLPRASRQGFILLPRVPRSGQGCWSPAS